MEYIRKILSCWFQGNHRWAPKGKMKIIKVLLRKVEERLNLLYSPERGKSFLANKPNERKGKKVPWGVKSGK